MDASENLYGTTGTGGAGLSGTVFKIDPSNALTTLHAFTGADGSGPMASLILDSSGNLFGTTTSGGTAGDGTIFKLDTSNSLTNLHSFSGADGLSPEAPLIVDSAGNFYGTAIGGGSNCPPYGCGTIFKLDTSNTLTTLHSFNGADGSSPEAALIEDSSGNFYGTTTGSPPTTGTVFKLDTSNTVTTLHAFTIPEGYSPWGSLIMDFAGNFYGTTLRGGISSSYCTFGCGTVFKLDSSNTLTILYAFTGGEDGSSPYASLIMDSSGNLYGTTSSGSGRSAGGAIFEIAVNACPSVSVAPTMLASGQINSLYSQSVSASGGSGPYIYSVTAGSMPTGLFLNSLTGLISGTPVAAGSSTFTISATDANRCMGSQSYTLTINAAAVRFYTIEPCRLIDTRRPVGAYGGPALQGSGAQRSFLIDGQCGIPSGAVAASANVTVVGATGGADLRIFPSGTPTPTVSSINFNAGQTRANNAILPMVGNPLGSITVRCDIPSGTTNMLLDINGYFAP
jgi:uncharacterized repeat protein (TIGR03803 family)